MTTAIHGKPPRLDYIPVAQIYTDHNYQRELDERRVQKLVKGFAWTKFGAISLIENGPEKFAVVDGQHRLEAARRLGFDSVPSSITNAGQFKTEAEIFLALNRDRKNVTPIERYWAGLAASNIDTMITGAEAIRKLSKGSASSALSKAIIEIYNHGYSGARIG